MRKITTSVFISLDGIVDADDEWQFPFLDDETFAALTEAWETSDAALVGRTTLDGFDDVRRTAPEAPVSQFLGSVDRYVVSSTQSPPSWPGTIVISGEVHNEIQRLKASAGGDILVIGSPTLIRWLLAEQLLDELAIIQLPVLARSGSRLFPPDSDSSRPDPLALALHDVRQLGNGSLRISYGPAGTSTD